MRLTSFTDYCLRVLIYVAAQPEGRATIAEIARTYGISENHLTKVVHSLGKAGFLTNVRGRGGGIGLARDATAINVGAVVRHSEGAAVPAACFEPGSPLCSISDVCRLRGVLDQAVHAFYAVLDRYTLQDLVSNRETLNRVLFPAFERATAAPS
jgi:Rrf2 family transcriptional regulator, nitric oxide-sensitive transcriptional repressor